MTLFVAFVADDHVNDLLIMSCLDDNIHGCYTIPIDKE